MKGVYKMENIVYKIELNRLNDILSVKNNLMNKNSYQAFGQFNSVRIEQTHISQLADIIKDYNYSVVNQYNSDTQIFYGYILDDEKSRELYQEFDEFDWYYQFITFIDFQDDIAYLDKLITQENIKYVLLNTFDKHSLIVMIRTKKISDGINFISSNEKKRKKWNVSYTLLLLNNDIDWSNIEEEQIKASLNFKIRSWDNFLILKNKIESIFGKTENNQQFYLGNSDYALYFTSVSVKELFPLFYNGNLLCNTNEILLNAAKNIHVSISILDDELINESLEIGKIDMNWNDQQEKYSEYINSLLKLEKKYIEDNSDDFTKIECANAFLKIIYLLRDVNYYDVNSKYLIEIILPALYECVIHFQLMKKIDVEEIYKALEEIHQSVETLLITNINSGHSFYTIPVLHYTPTKLIMFYSCYLRKLTHAVKQFKCFSKDNSVRYEFLLSPKLHNVVDVKSYTVEDDQTENRFLTVHMPVSGLFDLETSLIALTHEASHFLPNDELRCREDRTYSILNCTLIILIQEFSKDTDVITQQSRKKLINYVFDLKNEILLNFSTYDSPHKNYLVEGEKLIRNQLIEIIDRDRRHILNMIELNDDSVYTLDTVVTKFEKRINCLLDSNDRYSIHQMYINFERIYRECYSDLFMIKILKLDYENYIKAINKSFNNKEVIYSSFIATRIAFIIDSMKWNELFAEGVVLSEENKKNVSVFLATFNVSNVSKNMGYCMPGFYIQNIYLRMKEYFQKCVKVIDKEIDSTYSDENSQCIKNIQELFQNLIKNQNNISQTMYLLNNFMDNNALLQDMRVLKEIVENKIANDFK